MNYIFFTVLATTLFLIGHASVLTTAERFDNLEDESTCSELLRYIRMLVKVYTSTGATEPRRSSLAALMMLSTAN